MTKGTGKRRLNDSYATDGYVPPPSSVRASSQTKGASKRPLREGYVPPPSSVKRPSQPTAPPPPPRKK